MGNEVVSTFCQQTADSIINSQLKDNGLFYGKMGMAIFLYEYGYRENIDLYIKYADNMLDQIYKAPPMSPSFARGITGVGVGIEYLISQRLCLAKSNSILTDVDDYMYRIVTNEVLQKDKSFLHGEAGWLLYYYIRFGLKHKTAIKDKLDYKTMCMIAHDLQIYLYDNVIKLEQSESRFDLFNDFYTLLLLLTYLVKSKICEESIQAIMHALELQLVSYIPKLYFNRLYYIVVLSKVYDITKSDVIKQHIEMLERSIDTGHLQSEYQILTLYSLQQGLIGQLMVIKQYLSLNNTFIMNKSAISRIEHEMQAIVINLITDRSSLTHKVKILNSNDYSLANGLSGFGLAILHTLN